VARLLKEAAKLEFVSRSMVICPAPVKERGDLAEIFRGAEARLEGLPAQMERFARENGAEFLDAGTLIEVDELDGVHLSAAAHGTLGRAVAAKVRTIFT
jgi:lysophospholipase L1-like esterase